MTLRLARFPVWIPPFARVSFHDGFTDNRHGEAHDAIDIGAPEGTMVLAATAGVVLHRWMSGRGPVTGCGFSERGGNIVMILDDNGYAHYYAHLCAPPRVNAGQRVLPGTVLGGVGRTGSIAARGPYHLHYQVWAVGSGRDSEQASATFTRRFGRAVNPHSELVRLAAIIGARVGRNGSVAFDPL